MNPLPLVDLGGIWHIAFCLGLGLISCFLIFSSWGKSLPIIAKLLWIYIIFECLFILEWPKAHFGPFTPNFQETAGQALIEIILISLAALTAPRMIEKIVPFLALFATGCVWFNYSGLMHAPSFNMAFAAMCLPVIGLNLLSIFILVTALTHHGSTALLIIAAHGFTAVLKKEVKIKYFIAVCVVIFVSALYHQNQGLFNSGERIEHWIEYFHFWEENWKRIILGVGPGSFIWYSVMTHPYQTGFYLQIHSDWFQILWESGVTGFVLAVGTFWEAVRRAWKREDTSTLKGVFGCAVFALTYQPLRYFPTALLTAYFFSQALVIEGVELEFARFIRPIQSDY